MITKDILGAIGAANVVALVAAYEEKLEMGLKGDQAGNDIAPNSFAYE